MIVQNCTKLYVVQLTRFTICWGNIDSSNPNSSHQYFCTVWVWCGTVGLFNPDG